MRNPGGLNMTMGLNKQYATELHDRFGYLANWLPTANLKLGDVGTVKDGIFEKVATLDDLKVKFAIETHPDAGEIEYTSAGAVSQKAKGGANAPVAGGGVA